MMMKFTDGPNELTSTDFMAWISNYIHIKLWDVNTHIYPYFNTLTLVAWVITQQTQRNKHVIITSKCCFDVIIMLLLCFVFAEKLLLDYLFITNFLDKQCLCGSCQVEGNFKIGSLLV